MSEPAKVAYFSMEIALDPSMHTYSGGLGILAGDTLRSAADLGVPMVGVTLAYRKGYFLQRLDEMGNQTEAEDPWRPEDALAPEKAIATVVIEGRTVHVRAWRFAVQGISGHVVPVYLLDTDLPENHAWDRTLTDHLYGGDEHYRVCQEAILGIGGVRILGELGYTQLQGFHMNEGHSSFLALALLESRLDGRDLGTATESDIEAVRARCIFTTHTPVPAGHDQFSRSLVTQVLGSHWVSALDATHCCPEGVLNMTFVALRFSRYINGVAMRHGEISHGMYPNYPVHAITNGVNAVTWTSSPLCELYDRHIPEWRYDNQYFRYLLHVPVEEIQQAHNRAKAILFEELKKSTGVQFDQATMTLGFARRAATYKRADFLFSHPDRLISIAKSIGPLQIVYGGKAHPRDEGGKALIRKVFEAVRALKDAPIRFVYVPNYDWRWAQLITSGVDLWLNTPQRPHEASGTSGMKAALNGVPSLSVPDGWWLEGHMEGVTGWDIGRSEGISEDTESEQTSLNDKLQSVIVPMFYRQPEAYGQVMRSTIALNGSFFNTQRMLSQYLRNAYESIEVDLSAAAAEEGAS
ncbi:MAG TPA: alpha-glucan family phosphorylase [Candidatus Polarisedimenticolia bacterium]|nr:alpha-glucan family phosphorylase [Candidatus Polarisedimenticolia bacterium]